MNVCREHARNLAEHRLDALTHQLLGGAPPDVIPALRVTFPRRRELKPPPPSGRGSGAEFQLATRYGRREKQSLHYVVVISIHPPYLHQGR